MKLDTDQILQRVSNTESKRTKYVEMANQWEKMWLLDPGFSKTLSDSINKDGREQVITADPYNVVNLAQRLISTQPRIDVPPKDLTDDAAKAAQSKERFLTAMWQRIGHLQGRNILYDAAWLSLVRGRCAFEVKWVKDVLPPKLAERRFPILIRTLDPLNIGVHRGPLYTEYAYHKYREARVNVRQRYPKLKIFTDDDTRSLGRRFSDENDELAVIDFWWMSPTTGDIWNAVLVEDEFAKPPKKTNYTFIPIIEVYGDSAPTKDESHRGLSILYPLDGPWQYKCRLQSNLGTGVLWATWPFFAVENEEGMEVPDFKVRPGATEHVPAGTRINQVLPQVNMNVIESMLAKLDETLQQSAFPSVLYGDSGGMQAGYGVSLLSDSARGRIKSPLEYLEMAVMQVNEAVMSLAESFDDDDEGIEIWGKNTKDNKLFKLCLYGKDIGGYYENMVTLRPNLPQDDAQRMAFGLQMVNSGNLSKQTFWDKWVSVDMPNDEADRIWAQRAIESEELSKNMMVAKLIELYPQSWELIIAGSPLEQIAERFKKPPAPPQLPGAIGPEIPPGMMQPGMPPMPPGMGPPPGGPMPLQPPAIPMPQGGGIPPAMQGQIESENLGLPPDADPALFAQMMGNPLPPQEELNLLAGLPQEGL